MTARPIHYLSVCSGIEAATEAWHPLGWRAVAFAEIEPFPCAVLAHRYPDVPNLGDLTRYDGWPEELLAKADILVGGTPCQAFSVAGNRNSLNDYRGNLTLIYANLFDQIDSIRVRLQLPPAVCVWENVPGVLSTKDNAFGCFLAELAGEDAPLQPPGGRWTDAGLVRGPKRAVAWRILDAQYFGLAQRRRRVFLVAGAGDGFDPAEVLFECQGMRRDSPPSREPGEAASGGSSGRAGERSHWDGVDHPHPTLNQSHNTGGVGQSNQEPFSQRGAYLVEQPYTVAVDEVAETLIASDHKGPGHNRDHNFVTHALRGEGFDASEDGTGRGTPLVPISFYSNESRCDNIQTDGSSVPVKIGSGGSSGNPPAVAFAQNSRDEVREMAIVGALAAEPGMKQTSYIRQQIQVRRLTPRECERLQGFPDDYTLVPHRGKPAADGPRYKALGNSKAVPVIRWIGRRIKKTLYETIADHP